ncbi:MAG: aspartate kinase, partial [bacterium]
GDTTDELIRMAQEVNPSPSEREYDMLLATGEQVSIALLTMAIHALGCEAIAMTGAMAGIVTDNVHKKATITEVNPRRVLECLEEGKIVIVAGFQGMDVNEEVTTLGRGGSDTTAVALAAALGSGECEILTDVDGVFTADPKIVGGAVRKLGEVGCHEMLELASVGAKVLHPRSVELAKEYGVRLHVRSSFNRKRGTIVKGVEDLEKKRPVSGVALDVKTAKVSVLGVPDRPGVAGTLFGILGDNHINVDMIIQNVMRGGVNDITFTVSQDDLPKTVELMKSLPPEMSAEGVAVDDKIAKVSIVGAGMVSKPGVAAEMFRTLGGKGINIDMISTSEIRVSCIIARERGEEAVRLLHAAFELDREA